MQIIHGENIVKSRDQLFELIHSAKKEGLEVIRLEAKALAVAELETILGASDLFDTKKLIIIEGLHSLPRSTKKNDLTTLLESEQIHSVVLWEKRTLTKTMLKNFPLAKVSEHKISKPLFAWLETMGENIPTQKKLRLLHEAYSIDSAYFCFIMLIRQSRLLLLAKSGSKITGPPFMKVKLEKQAASFNLDDLIALHKKLLQIDHEQKTSKNLLSLEQQLDLLTVAL